MLPACMRRLKLSCESEGGKEGQDYGWLGLPRACGQERDESELVTLPKAVYEPRSRRVTGGRMESSLRSLADDLDGRAGLWLGKST